MQELNKYLDEFYPIIHTLNLKGNKNVLIGGTAVIKLYGLNFPRPIGDLDIIIHNPTNEQKDYIYGMKFFDIEHNVYGHSFKFMKKDLYLNILFTEVKSDEISRSVKYEYKGVLYPLVSINEIITAKKNYGREKDYRDFLLLKNENFNPL